MRSLPPNHISLNDFPSRCKAEFVPKSCSHLERQSPLVGEESAHNIATVSSRHSTSL